MSDLTHSYKIHGKNREYDVYVCYEYVHEGEENLTQAVDSCHVREVG